MFFFFLLTGKDDFLALRGDNQILCNFVILLKVYVASFYFLSLQMPAP